MIIWIYLLIGIILLIVDLIKHWNVWDEYTTSKLDHINKELDMNIPPNVYKTVIIVTAVIIWPAALIASFFVDD